MFCQKASVPVEEAMVAEVIAVAGVMGHRQEHPGAAAQDHTVARSDQVLAPVGKAPAGATVAAPPPVHRDRAHRGQAAQSVKDRVPRVARRPTLLFLQET